MCSFEYCKISNELCNKFGTQYDSFVKHQNQNIMETPRDTSHHNKNIEGYKVPGDGNERNDLPQPGNKSFEENPNAMTHKSQDDIPGKEFNTGDKAFFDSSKEDFVKTVSSLHHATPTNLKNIDLAHKTPDGDR